VPELIFAATDFGVRYLGNCATYALGHWWEITLLELNPAICIFVRCCKLRLTFPAVTKKVVWCSNHNSILNCFTIVLFTKSSLTIQPHLRVSLHYLVKCFAFLLTLTGSMVFCSHSWKSTKFWIQQFQYAFGVGWKQPYCFWKTFQFSDCDSDIPLSLKVAGHQIQQSHRLTVGAAADAGFKTMVWSPPL